ncbi:MAG: hypothetical protein ACE5FH_12220 [Candidatus Zixiibacteriota bacterium]
MSPLGYINRYINLIIETLRQVGAVRIWLLLSGWAFFQWLLLFALESYPSSWVHGPVSFLLSLYDPAEATGFKHYPGHYLLLPKFFDWGRFWMGALIEGAVLGVVARIYYGRFVGSVPGGRSPFEGIGRMLIHIVPAWLTINGLTIMISLFVPDLAQPFIHASPRATAVFEWIVMPSAYALVWALFFFLIPSIAMYRDTFGRALRRSLSIFLQNPITSLFLSAMVLAGPFVISSLAGKTVTIVEKFHPEMVYWALVVELAVEVVAYYMWMGTAVRFLVEVE